MDPIIFFEKSPNLLKKWISVDSELLDLNDNNKKIKIELMDDGMPRAIAFFDIDGTLAHLSLIHGASIQKLFPEQEPKELEDTYYRGFKLGNSFREFDRMKGIYVDGHIAWKDPEVYWKERFIPHAKEIDEPGNLAHNIADAILKEYGLIAAEISEDMYKKNKEEFEKANIQSIFRLATIYSGLGIPMVGFTANAKVFVSKLAKYLKLSDLFLEIATDEDMQGGGKERAINYLISMLEQKGISVPKDRLVFIGDSLRGDIGSSLVEKKRSIFGQGILVLETKEALIEIKKQISNTPELKKIVDSIDTYGLVVNDVPLDDKGNPMLLSRFREKFLEKL